MKKIKSPVHLPPLDPLCFPFSHKTQRLKQCYKETGIPLGSLMEDMYDREEITNVQIVPPPLSIPATLEVHPTNIKSTIKF